MKHTNLRRMKYASNYHGLHPLQRFAMIGRMLINKGIELSEKVKTWKRKGEGMNVKLVAGVKYLFGDNGQERAIGDQ
jgi:hypothetical protein